MSQEENNISFFELLGNLQAREEALKKLASKTNDQERILDLATGSGYLARNLIDKDVFVVCLDLDFGPLINAKKELSNILFVVADARHLPFKSSSFDSVVTWSALVHIDAWRDVIEESFQVSKRMLTAEPHGAFSVRSFRDFRCKHEYPNISEIQKEFEKYSEANIDCLEFISIISSKG